MVQSAGERFIDLGYDNAVVVVGDLEAGYPSEAPYDAIFVNGAVEFIPDGLLEQLRDGGRLVCVEGSGNAARATTYRRDGDVFSAVLSFNAAIKSLPGFTREKAFEF
nr:hypothetical protein [Marinicella sp. W31]MDC2877409.1 hypothetical protein [Marinicella sp. W31]